MVPALLLLALPLLSPAPPAAAPAAASQPATPATTVPRVGVHPVDLAVEVTDAKGVLKKLPTAADFTVTEDGEPRQVLYVEPYGQTPWRFVIYIDRVLASSRTLRSALGALSAHAAELTALGTVEVVIAEPDPVSVQPASRDPYAIAETLARLSYTLEGLDGVRVVRRRFRDESVAPAPEAAPAGESASGTAGVAADAAEEEVRLVRRQADSLAAWLSAQATEGDRPGALFYIADGWDRDPREFYRRQPGVREKGKPEAKTDPLAPFTLEGDSASLAHTLAALGWTTLPLAVGEAPLPDLRHPRFKRPEEPSPRVGLALPEHDKDKELEKELEKKREGDPLLLRPLEPLQEIARASGGETLESPLAVPDVLARLRGRFRLRYEAVPAADGHSRSVALKAPTSAAWTLHARNFVNTGIPPEVAALRARRLLEGEEGSGDLPLTAALKIEDGGPTGRQAQVEVRLDPGTLPALPAGSVPQTAALRLTAAAPGDGFAARLLQRPLTAEDAVAEEPWTYRFTLPLPEGADRLAVVVDLPANGLWGGELAAVVTGEAEEGATVALLPAPDVVHLLQPGREPLTGRIQVAA
ncbi:MAG TPA: hypothetical protein VMM92_12960, partial [Thermoanaerobaculia bacterium]|nr:hypothetical protein [Thermoanaerobaculia bacterium]